MYRMQGRSQPCGPEVVANGKIENRYLLRNEQLPCAEEISQTKSVCNTVCNTLCNTRCNRVCRCYKRRKAPSREAQAKVCAGCSLRLAREWNGRPIPRPRRKKNRDTGFSGERDRRSLFCRGIPFLPIMRENSSCGLSSSQLDIFPVFRG